MQTSIDLGNRTPGEVISHTIEIKLICDSKKHADRGTTVTVSKKDSASVIPADGALSMTAVTFTIPMDWPEDATGGGTNCSTPPQELSKTTDVQLTAPTTPGFYSYELAIERSVSQGTPGDVKDPNPPKLTFTLAVVAGDTTPPVVTCPPDQTTEGNTTGGYTGSISEATATDDTDPAPTVTREPRGDHFPLGTTTVTWTATDASGNAASCSADVTIVDTTPPTITCPPDVNGTVGQPVSLGSPTVEDIVDPEPSVSNDAPASFGPGKTTVTWTATDSSGNSATCEQVVTLTYIFGLFQPPIENLPVVNVVKAGSTIPVKWRLFGYFGDYVRDLSAVASIKSASIPCDAIDWAPNGEVAEVVDSAGETVLRYDLTNEQFLYNWKTAKSWKESCRVLLLSLDDGTTHWALCRFK